MSVENNDYKANRKAKGIKTGVEDLIFDCHPIKHTLDRVP
jgi:hypothetical protein